MVFNLGLGSQGPPALLQVPQDLGVSLPVSQACFSSAGGVCQHWRSIVEQKQARALWFLLTLGSASL